MEFLDLKKNLKKDFSHLPKARLALLGDSTTQLLVQAIRGYGYEVGLDLEIFEADYDQIDHCILDRSSALHGFAPEFVVIFQSTTKLLQRFYGADNSAKHVFAEQEAAKIAGWLQILSAQSPQTRVITLNFPEIDDGIYGNFANKTPLSFVCQVRKLNVALMNLAQGTASLQVCDAAILQNLHGASLAHDARLEIDAGMVFSLQFLPVVAKSLIDIILASLGRLKKCLILDLDNTLWGGVIGDDGLEGIQLGDLGQGKAFAELQQWAKQLRHRGVVLAICSKNDEKIAKEPFLQHPDMVLTLDDIAIFLANWGSKVDNLKRIRDFLNIGYDSMVFLDDSAYERDLVRQNLPAITVPELPADPADCLPYLRALNLFEAGSITEADEQRTRQLQAEGSRVALQQSFTDESAFLATLGMTARVQPFDRFSIPRVAQLLQRSNQFNLRTIRHSEEEVARIATSSDHLHYAITLKDRFGEYGLISAAILQKQGDALFIDSWIMSCRVLRRGVESLLLNAMVSEARQWGFSSIVGEYVPTPKNGLVKDHFAKLGFSDAGHGRWTLPVKDYVPQRHFILVPADPKPASP
jgi:FkbH-like protein